MLMLAAVPSRNRVSRVGPLVREHADVTARNRIIPAQIVVTCIFRFIGYAVQVYQNTRSRT